MRDLFGLDESAFYTYEGRGAYRLRFLAYQRAPRGRFDEEPRQVDEDDWPASPAGRHYAAVSAAAAMVGAARGGAVEGGAARGGAADGAEADGAAVVGRGLWLPQQREAGGDAAGAEPNGAAVVGGRLGLPQQQREAPGRDLG